MLSEIFMDFKLFLNFAQKFIYFYLKGRATGLGGRWVGEEFFYLLVYSQNAYYSWG